MQTEIKPDELNTILLNAINAYAGKDQYTHALMKLMFDTGLRVNEVCEPKRWQKWHGSTYRVELEKGDSTRTLSDSLIPPILADMYNYGNVPGVLTYSSLNWRIKKATPVITVNGDIRRSNAHLFRYNYCKQLYQAGKTVAQIQAIIKHKSLGSTAFYVFDRLYINE